MLSGVHVICFAASYAVTLILEITRLLFRSGVRGAMIFGFASAGLLAHTVYLYHRWAAFYKSPTAGGSPLSSEKDWYLVAAWVLVVFYLYVISYHPRTAVGLFLLPLTLGLIGIASFVAEEQPFPREAGSKVWGLIHGGSILLGSVAVLIGFASGLMYLRQARRLKHKLPPPKGLRLPSLEWLQKTNSRTLTLALMMIGLGILSGMMLNAANRGRGADSLPWYDSVVLSTGVMFGWLLVSAGIGMAYRPAGEGRRVAYHTLVSFVFLVIVLALVLSGRTKHGGGRSEDRQPGAMSSPSGGSHWRFARAADKHGHDARATLLGSARGGWR